MLNRTSLTVVLPFIATLGACSAESSSAVDSSRSALEEEGIASYTNVYTGRNGQLVDVEWFQWKDGSCVSPTLSDGTPYVAGAVEGAPCKYAWDCEATCNSCPTVTASFMARACIDHVCAAPSLAASVALSESQHLVGSRPSGLCAGETESAAH